MIDPLSFIAVICFALAYIAEKRRRIVAEDMLTLSRTMDDAMRDRAEPFIEARAAWRN